VAIELRLPILCDLTDESRASTFYKNFLPIHRGERNKKKQLQIRFKLGETCHQTLILIFAFFFLFKYATKKVADFFLRIKKIKKN